MPVERPLEPAERALKPAERAERAWRPLEASWEAWSHLGGPAERPGEGRERERERERSVPGMWWYHRSSSPMEPLPKSVTA